MKKPPNELLEFLYRYDPTIQTLALGLRKVALEEMAPCHEYIFEMRSRRLDQPRVSASSFSTVFQLRAVPAPPRCLSIRFGVSFERPTPSG